MGWKGCLVTLLAAVLSSSFAIAFVNVAFSTCPSSTTVCFAHSDDSSLAPPTQTSPTPEGGGQKAVSPHFLSGESIAWVQQMLDGFEATFNTSLIPGVDRATLTPEEQAQLVALADVAIVSHDFLRNPDDPIFIYANAAGLQTFGYTWDEFTALPSRKSCEEEVQAEREKLLRKVRKSAESTPAVDYSGVRVTKAGERFRISAAVWNVKDSGGRTVGQAARVVVRD